jgi:hypothetical protein
MEIERENKMKIAQTQLPEIGKTYRPIGNYLSHQNSLPVVIDIVMTQQIMIKLKDLNSEKIAELSFIRFWSNFESCFPDMKQQLKQLKSRKSFVMKLVRFFHD